MNVLVICPVYEPYAGGGGQYFPLLVSELVKSPVINSVVVLTERHPERGFVERKGSVIVYRFLPRRDTIKKGLVYKTITFVFTYMFFRLIVPFLVKKHNIHIIHYTRYLRRAFYNIMRRCQSKYNVKVVLDMRATLEAEEPIINLHGVDCVISNSEAVYNQVARFINNKYTHELVKNPIQLPAKSGKAVIQRVMRKYGLAEKKYFIMVGQLMPRKSTEEVVDAFPLITKHLPDYNLVLVGRNMLGAKIIEKIKENKIDYLGPVGHDDAMLLIEGAELVLQPSKIEGIPRVSIESLALGKKVLLPPCAPELIRDNEFFTISSYEPASIAEAIVRIVEGDKTPVYDLSNHDVKFAIEHVVRLYQV